MTTHEPTTRDGYTFRSVGGGPIRRKRESLDSDKFTETKPT